MIKKYRAVAIMSQKRDKALLCGKKLGCTMAAEGKLVSNSQSLHTIHWIYTG